MTNTPQLSDAPQPPQLELTFTQLPKVMYSKADPSSVSEPRALLLNSVFAEELGIEVAWLQSADAVKILSGNELLEGEGSIASAYAGHQFGHQNPRLGDGRAHLLGELITPRGQRVDLQLKGSGTTPYSRQGDGRSPLGPVIREYVVSEGMAAMGVATSRSLAAMATGENVWREKGAEPGAILTRVADSHIRVGSFEFAAMQGSTCVKSLADYVIQRHFAELSTSETPYLNLLEAVIAKQAQLIAQWMSLGFIHGVMNTDNMLVCGQTIDYGPCAFMDAYDPLQVYSFIDRQGRYRYDNQPGIGQWNLVRFAESLIGLMGDDRDAAITQAQQTLNNYQIVYEQTYSQLMGAKLGLHTGFVDLVTDLLAIMQAEELDYTLTFRHLMTLLVDPTADSTFDSKYGMPVGVLKVSNDLLAWQEKWLAEVHQQTTAADALALMATHNPVFIPRNHLVDEAIKAAYKGDMGLTNGLHTATVQPFEYNPEWQHLALPPQAEQVIANTFCGT